MNIIKLGKDNLELVVSQAAEIICSGGIVVAPFDTVYGFLADAANDEAIERIRDLKERAATKTIGLAVSDIASMQTLGRLSEAAAQYVKVRIPGKYTFIIPLASNVVISKYCTQNGTAGIRVPDSDLILKIAEASGGVVAQTSANKSGLDNVFSVDELKSQFGEDELVQIDLIVDGGEIPTGPPSLLVNLTGDKPREIER